MTILKGIRINHEILECFFCCCNEMAGAQGSSAGEKNSCSFALKLIIVIHMILVNLVLATVFNEIEKGDFTWKQLSAV